MKIYLLYVDTVDSGGREEWNVFYTPVEAFTTPQNRDSRKAFLTQKFDKSPNYGKGSYDFHEEDLVLDPPTSSSHPMLDSTDDEEQEQ